MFQVLRWLPTYIDKSIIVNCGLTKMGNPIHPLKWPTKTNFTFKVSFDFPNELEENDFRYDSSEAEEVEDVYYYLHTHLSKM